MANILTAEQLIEERQKATKKQLPSFGCKEFCVTGSEEEKEKIDRILSTTKSLLAGERVEKSNLLSNAEWDKDLKLSKVTKKVGKFFETFGHSVNGCEYLYPEESLFLLENCNLELFFCGLSVSIQRGYSLLLSVESGCTLNEYRVYAYLSKSGYRVFRHDPVVTVQNREKQISSSSLVPSKLIDSGEQEISQVSISIEELDGTSVSEEVIAEDNTSTNVSVSNEEVTKKVDGTEVSRTLKTSSLANAMLLLRNLTQKIQKNRDFYQKAKRRHRRSKKKYEDPLNRFLCNRNAKATDGADNPEVPLEWIRYSSLDEAIHILQTLSEQTEDSEFFVKNAAPIIKLKERLTDALSESFFPPANESLFNSNTELVKSFVYPTEPEDVSTGITQSDQKSPGLQRDEEFAEIVSLFPTFENGMLSAHMPPFYKPPKIKCKYFSITMNKETRKIERSESTLRFSPNKAQRIYNPPSSSAGRNIVHDFKRIQDAPSSHVAHNSGSLPSQTSPDKSKFQGKAKSRCRYFTQPSRNVSSEFSPHPKRTKSQKRLARQQRRVGNLRLRNISREKKKCPDNVANEFKNISIQENLNVSSSNRLIAQTTLHSNQPPENQRNPFQSASPNEKIMDSALPTPFTQSTSRQTPFNQQLHVKPEFQQSINQPFGNEFQQTLNQPLPSEQALLNNPMNPLTPNVLGQVIANVVSQLLPNQVTQNMSNLMPQNFQNPMTPNFPNSGTPNFQSPPFPNFQNPITPNFQSPAIPNFPSPAFPNFQNPITPNFQNSGNPTPFNQMNPPFANQENPSFFNQSGPNFHNQNFGHRYPSQRFQRPYNNWNNNSPMSEVTRHARRMQGMAKRMLAVAQAMFKNPEEFAENPEKINTYSNRFRHPNDSRPWRHPNQMQNSNDSFRNNFRPRFDTFQNSNSNFGQNSFNSNFSENSFNRNTNQINYQSNQPDSSQPRNDETMNAGNFENSYDTSETKYVPETKFNPSAPAPRASSNSNSQVGNDNLFFVDVVGDNPSNLLSKARTIQANKPTVSFGGKRPAESSSSSDSSDEESDGDDIQVIEPSNKKPNVETIDVLSSDEEIFMTISSKVNRSKHEANQICSKLGQKFKSSSIDDEIDSVCKKRKIDNCAEIITLDDDVLIIDEPVFLDSSIECVAQTSCFKPNSRNVEASNNSTINEPIANVKQENDDSSSVQSCTNDSEDNEVRVSAAAVKQEKETTDAIPLELEFDRENTNTVVSVKTEICSNVNELEKEAENQNLSSNLAEKSNESCSNISLTSTVKVEGEDEHIDKSIETEDSDTSETDEDSERDTSFDSVPFEKPTSIETEKQPSEESVSCEKTADTSKSTAEKSSVNENSSETSWAALKVGETVKLSEDCSRSTSKTVPENAAVEPTAIEVDESIANKEKDINKTENLSKTQDGDKLEALLQPRHCKNLGSVLNALQIFKSKGNDPRDVCPLKVTYDVYQPKKVFAKVSRPDPDFRIIVTGYLDPVPSPAQIDEIMNRYSDSVKTLFAVVHPSSISFFFIGNVQVPVQIDDLLF